MEVSMKSTLCEKLLIALVLLGLARSVLATETPADTERPSYGVTYTAWIKAGEPWATVRVRLTRNADWVRWMRFNADPKRYAKFKSSGELTVEGSQVLWRPPARDAWLQYRVNLDSRRDSGRHDGLVTADWALFRADDLVPPVHLDMQDGTQSRAKLRLHLPDGWSAVTPFPRYASGRLKIDNPHRLFDRPTGWMLLGKLGVRRERIGETELTVAAPVGEPVRRMDLLAFFRWNIPVLQQIFPAFPERILIVSAGDPMWRGALSAPRSLYVHAERPMISENATSTFIHELVHVAMSARSAAGADWITEGLAEYYSLDVLRRSNTISRSRFDKAHRDLQSWGERAGPLESARADGAITARAVGILRSVDSEIRGASEGRHSLDDVVRQLASERLPITRERFSELATEFAGKPLQSLAF